MAYKFSETSKVNDEFTKVFGIGFKPFYDGLASVATKQLWIDVLKFDEWLRKKHGNYEDEGKSMNDVIREHYGDKGVKLVGALTGADDEKGPKSDIVEIEGVKTVAERTEHGSEVTYKPYRNYHKGLDVNQVVYDLMTIAAHDILATFGTATYGGNFTAAEMAGTVGYLHQFAENSDYKLVNIKTETFCCSYHAGEAFAQMAEWEGVMNLSPKKYYRFTVEGKEMPKDVKLKPYTRCHQPKPSNPYSAAQDAARINKKFEVLGELRRRLSSEGMKKALAVLCAAKQWENCQSKYRMALEVMRRRLWKDYGTDKYAGPMSYTARDFESGPEIWKQVDVDYANMLRKLFCDMLNAAPAPKWISAKDYVQVKDNEKVVEKLQGKLYVTNVYAKLDSTGEKLVWFANVLASKGKTEWQFEVDRLEPCKESKKGKTKAKTQTKVKDTPADVKDTHADVKSTREPTLAERLREALLKQFKQAA